MEKMISPNGVKANMCCASCLYLYIEHGTKRWCKKKNKAITEYGYKCGYYVMAKFFQERGYKIIRD